MYQIRKKIPLEQRRYLIFQEAMLKLMHPHPSLPADDPLLCYQYNDSEKWSMTEIEAFHQALLKYDKDFFNIAQDVSFCKLGRVVWVLRGIVLLQVGTKTVKQCVQFYYMWKKVCTDDYRKFKQSRDRRCGFKRGYESDIEEKPYPDAKLLGVSTKISRFTFTFD